MPVGRLEPLGSSQKVTEQGLLVDETLSTTSSPFYTESVLYTCPSGKKSYFSGSSFTTPLTGVAVEHLLFIRTGSGDFIIAKWVNGGSTDPWQPFSLNGGITTQIQFIINDGEQLIHSYESTSTSSHRLLANLVYRELPI